MDMTGNSSEESVERRSHTRFECKNCAVTVNFKSGQIVNISLGGFAFCYTHFEEWPQNKVEKGILFGDNILLHNVPFDTISDSIMPDPSPGLVVVRQRGVKFGHLTPSQKSCLEKFILHISK